MVLRIPGCMGCALGLGRLRGLGVDGAMKDILITAVVCYVLGYAITWCIVWVVKLCIG